MVSEPALATALLFTSIPAVVTVPAGDIASGIPFPSVSYTNWVIINASPCGSTSFTKRLPVTATL